MEKLDYSAHISTDTHTPQSSSDVQQNSLTFLQSYPDLVPYQLSLPALSSRFPFAYGSRNFSSALTTNVNIGTVLLRSRMSWPAKNQRRVSLSHLTLRMLSLSPHTSSTCLPHPRHVVLPHLSPAQCQQERVIVSAMHRKIWRSPQDLHLMVKQVSISKLVVSIETIMKNL